MTTPALPLGGLSYVVTAGTITNSPGGGAGSIQYNNTGTFGGFVASGDATITTSTGAVVVSAMTGGTTLNYVAKTATYTAIATDYVINCTSGTFTVSLPTAISITGRVYVVKNSGTGTITVDPNGSQTIDGALTVALATQYQSIMVMSNGANWIVI